MIIESSVASGNNYSWMLSVRCCPSVLLINYYLLLVVIMNVRIKNKCEYKIVFSNKKASKIVHKILQLKIFTIY